MTPSQLGLQPVTGNRAEKESLNQWRAAKVFLVKHLKVKTIQRKFISYRRIAQKVMILSYSARFTKKVSLKHNIISGLSLNFILETSQFVKLIELSH